MAKKQLVSFQKLALGARFRYPENDQIWILTQIRGVIGKKFNEGTIVQYDKDFMTKRGNRQSICGHYPEENGGDCSDLVEFVI